MSKPIPHNRKSPAAMGRTVVLHRSRSRARAFQFPNSQVIITAAGVRTELDHPDRNGLWISCDRLLTQELLKQIARPNTRLGSAIFLHDLTPTAIAALSGCFHHVAFAQSGGFLEPQELAEALLAENRRDLLIGCLVDRDSKTVILWRGDLEPLTVPFAAFPKSADGIKPNFASAAVVDYGQTLQFGEYEAAADAILYEFDADYRRRIKKERAKSEQTFGASLRRLRKQRGLTRDDFAPHVAAKTVSRIELGQVKRVQTNTLNALAERLGVRPEEIGTF